MRFVSNRAGKAAGALAPKQPAALRAYSLKRFPELCVMLLQAAVVPVPREEGPVVAEKTPTSLAETYPQTSLQMSPPNVNMLT